MKENLIQFNLRTFLEIKVKEQIGDPINSLKESITEVYGFTIETKELLVNLK